MDDYICEVQGISAEALTLRKRTGSWLYKFFPSEIEPEVLDILRKRQQEGWDPICLAQFKSEGKLLKLRNLLL